MAGAGEGRRPDGRYDEILIDPTRAQVVVDWMHHLVHLGELFFISDVTTTASPVVYRFKTGSKELHIKFTLSTGLKVAAQILEDVTITLAGTLQTKQNYNRDSAKTLETLVYKGSTYTGGTAFRNNQSGFGTTPGLAASGNNSTGIEYNFAPNTEYILLLTPTASTDLVLIADFYEETHP